MSEEKSAFDVLKEFDKRIKEHEKRIDRISNTLLNIHYNSDMWMKIQRIEQELIKIKTQINFKDNGSS